jgi:hypothetical protein
LDQRFLPDFERWDIRRYSSTQIAIRMIGGECPDAGAPLFEPAGLSPTNGDGDESENDLDE